MRCCTSLEYCPLALGRSSVVAERALQRLREGEVGTDGFETIDDAEAWLQRVHRWRANTLNALRDDAIAAPGDSTERWLLYVPQPDAQKDASTTITCDLCRKCKGALSRKNGTAVDGPDAQMPHLCRARGLWAVGC